MRTTKSFAILSTLAVIVAASLAVSCRPDDTELHISAAAPYYSSLGQVAAEATVILEGEVVGERGLFNVRSSVPELNELFANRVVDVRVTRVHAQAREATVEPGDVVAVGMAAVSPGAKSGLSNYQEHVENVASYSTPLTVGAVITVFAAPAQFADDLDGWTVVGSDYGVLIHAGPERIAQAPIGPLNGARFSDGQLQTVTGVLGKHARP